MGSDVVAGIVKGWGRIITGRTPNLSIEITRECPLRCPGCYAYGSDHLGGDLTLRQVSDYKGDALVTEFMKLIDQHQPVHLSIVGGEPLVRYRELGVLLPKLSERGIYTQVVTSAVRPIPAEWAAIPQLQIVVSIDGLQPEHDERRKPATYARILQHIKGQHITVHCTVTRQQVQRDGYLEEFVDFWSRNEDVDQFWVSLYTPQIGETSSEILQPEDRTKVIAELLRLREIHPKLKMPKGLLALYREPPSSPAECVFAQTTTCVSADLERRITPCQFGGNPDCSQCGCIASAGLAAVARHKLPGGIPVGAIFWTSHRIGAWVRAFREGASGGPTPTNARGPAAEPQV
jgi:MoaA/NifB/PqqE/SkfB family radical SAM enzyme